MGAFGSLLTLLLVRVNCRVIVSLMCCLIKGQGQNLLSFPFRASLLGTKARMIVLLPCISFCHIFFFFGKETQELGEGTGEQSHKTLENHWSTGRESSYQVLNQGQHPPNTLCHGNGLQAHFPLTQGDEQVPGLIPCIVYALECILFSTSWSSIPDIQGATQTLVSNCLVCLGLKNF